jgi:hypothetical protein
MCVIVDANVAQDVFGAPADAPSSNRDAYKTLQRDISLGVMPIVYGGKLVEEYAQCGSRVWGRIAELRRAGRAFRFADEEIQQEAATLVVAGHCVSDDTHILALARVSGARLVCTRDAKLMQDFKNRAVVGKPRGKVWSPAAHKTLRARFCHECGLT